MSLSQVSKRRKNKKIFLSQAFKEIKNKTNIQVENKKINNDNVKFIIPYFRYKLSIPRKIFSVLTYAITLFFFKFLLFSIFGIHIF
jgi:hypothetical protein